MSWLGGLALWWQSRKTRSKMERVFSRGEDPFKYAKSGYELKRLEAMERALGDRRFGRVLEVGCAEGHFSQRLAGRCESLTVLDISQTAIERARKAVPNAEFVCADIRAWEPKGQFDLIVLGDVLYYLDKPLVREQFEKTFDRINMWLSPLSRLMLAHAFATPGEEQHRQDFTRRFLRLGLKKISEEAVVPDETENPVRCLLVVLEK